MTDVIWDKGGSRVDTSIQHFLTGDDIVLDRTLFPFDIQATAAHVAGLQRIGIINDGECAALTKTLHDLLAAFETGAFVLDERFEDGHSAIESFLTARIGDAGRKVHTGRSRNDQVLTALRLYMKSALKQGDDALRDTALACLEIARREEWTPMPGYTHLQRAVPSSIGTWMAGFAEAFTDAAELLRMMMQWIDACPLGTAAGFGVNLPLDRAGVASELGFDRLQVNPLYAQTSRGLHEVQVLSAFGQAALIVRRLAWDLSLFTMSEFGFVTLPDAYTTGSSIMPNKRNPDVIELLRTPAAVVWSALQEITAVLALPSGYHRDLQATKGPLIRGTESALSALAVVPDLVRRLTFDRQRMRHLIDEDMYATDRAVESAREGTPFRVAYKAAVTRPAQEPERTPEQSLADRVSPGGPGNLMLDEIAARLEE